MRFFVTGARGFVGSRLARFLIERGDEVAGSVYGRRETEEPFEAFEVDILDPDAVVRAVDRAAPDAIIHLAGLSHVGSSWENVADYFRVNVLGTQNVLAAAQGCRVVLASSAEVYGLVPERKQPIGESAPLDPRNPYAMSKASAELLALDRGAMVMRSFNLIGPGQAETFALPSFARQLAEIGRGAARPVLKVGNLEARRDFLHVDDAMSAYRLVACEGVSGECYNLGSGEAYSVREILDLLLEVSDVDARTEMDPERFRPVDVPLTRADNGKLKDLGWAPQLGVERALRDLWQSLA